MRGSVYSLEHFLQVVLGESWVTFDAIFKLALLKQNIFKNSSYSVASNQQTTQKPIHPHVGNLGSHFMPSSKLYCYTQKGFFFLIKAIP